MAWSWVGELARRRRHNLQTLKTSPLAEISGALGDLGTLLPLMTALALQGSVSLSSTLVWSGICNVATGMLFGIPLPVQPMKAIAAAAIASRAPLRETIAAGALVSAAVLLLAATGLLRWLARWVPVPVVKGIQLGAGLSLIISAGNSLLGPLGWLTPSPFDNRLWALAAFVGLLLTQRQEGEGPRHPGERERGWGWGWGRGRGGGVHIFPYALVLFLTGVFLSIAYDLQHGHGDHLPSLSWWRLRFVTPRWGASDAWSMAVAQLPLTTLNSVVAVSALAEDLFGGEYSRDFSVAGVTAFGCSVGAMNLAGCWLGAMPVCHGAGGLAAQYRFGARSGASVALLGVCKLLIGLCLGETLIGLLSAFPASVLGVLVLAAGLELALVGHSLNYGAPDLWEAAVEAAAENAETAAATGRGLIIKKRRTLSNNERKERWTVMLTTVAGILAFKNDAVGFAAGLLCHGAYRLADWVALLRQRLAGETRPSGGVWPSEGGRPSGEARPLLAS